MLDCNRCGKCCADTSMQLSPQDIRRLQRLGYDPSDFTTKKGGFDTLKNVNGVCYFFEAKSNACKVYACRPEGCRYYPIVYSIDERKPVIDGEVCERTFTITGEEIKRAAPRLAELAKQLMRKGLKQQEE
ncbi:MAG: YkgJ family cysteine cluster protein [Promethearchaeati archaeon SRVP18_Atabeyarchaeia-1]